MNKIDYYYTVNHQLDGGSENMFFNGLKDISIYDKDLNLIKQIETSYANNSKLEVLSYLEENDLLTNIREL